nr:LysM domain-containing protein [Anaerolineae bacterium]
MAMLYGKGVWLLYSANVDLAIEMAVEIGATRVLYKTGHRAMFFPETARRVHDRVRAAGLTPFAWSLIFCDDPEGEARVALKTAEVGYEGIVFDIEDQAAGQQANATELGQRLLDAGLNPDMLYYTSFPNITQHFGIPYAEMNAFCKGGFMPQSYPTFLKPAEVVIHKMTYDEHAKWSEIWGYSPPIYPILAGYRDEQGTDRLTPEEFIPWANALAEHNPTFFSFYRAAVTNRDLWPILAALAVPQPPEPESPVEKPTGPSEPALLKTAASAFSLEAVEQPVYVTVQPDDTIWMLCQKHGCTRAQFWEWNWHLWDERGLPRDANYLQAGWRVRIG